MPPPDASNTTPASPITLARADRHELSGGDGLQFAPPHPLWLDRPGFWDGLFYFSHRIRPAFTLALLDEDGREIRLLEHSREWRPGELAVRWTADEVAADERRVLLAGGCAASEWTLVVTGDGPRDLRLIAWSAPESAELEPAGCVLADGAIRWRLIAPHVQRRPEPLPLDCTLAFEDGPADAHAIVESQVGGDAPNPPDLALTPIAELLGAASAVAPADGAGRRVVFMAVSRNLRLEPGHAVTITATLRVVPLDPALALPRAANVTGKAAGTARRACDDFLANAPYLTCDDAYVEHAFANRWAGLRLNFLAPIGRYAHPTCAEGTEFFHAAVSYSAWCHARELRWLDAVRARGVIRTFLREQRADGSLPGIVYLTGTHPTATYFADWGVSVLAVDDVHPDRGFLEEAYGPLARYADHLSRDRDAEGSGLYDVRDPYETGQEYMSRYTAVDPAADAQHFDYALRLKGVDITIYAYRLRRALARIAAAIGRQADIATHDRIADRMADAVRASMWDAAAGMFSDIDPRTGRRTGIAAAVGFYPYMTDIVGPEHLEGLHRNLFDPARFWPAFPVPSTALDDPLADAEGRWRGVRRLCPWNGRVWPMTNSHVIEALGMASALDPSLRARCAELIAKTFRMMARDGDPARPTSYEHYSPLTGRPALYRGLDDYQHSFLNDLTIRWVVGFRPAADGFVVDPLPLPIERLRLERLPFRGRRLSVDWEGDELRVSDGARSWTGRRGEPLAVRL